MFILELASKHNNYFIIIFFLLIETDLYSLYIIIGSLHIVWDVTFCVYGCILYIYIYI